MNQPNTLEPVRTAQATKTKRPKASVSPYAWWWGWLFVGPCVLGLLVFTYIPVLGSLALSFCRWNLLGAPVWVGPTNYLNLLQDPVFWKTMTTTGTFVLASVVLEVSLALGLALLLNQTLRGIGLFRMLYFLPVVSPMVSVALVWGWLLDPQYGGITALVMALGGPRIAWLFDPAWALWAVVMIRVWKDVGYPMLILLAGLQAIPQDLYESARIDGASWWHQLTTVTLPMLSPTLFFVLTVSMIQSFQSFDVVYLLTEGGPAQSTQLLVYSLFKHAFQFYKVGPASAMAYVLFLIILSLTALQWHLRKRWVLYESDQ